MAAAAPASGYFPGELFHVGIAARATVTRDFNGDGHLDLATANGMANSVGVLLNDGSGGFPATAYYLSGSGGSGPPHVALGDANGDGRLDIMTDHVLLFGQAP